jgi:hypothetical protein
MSVFLLQTAVFQKQISQVKSGNSKISLAKPLFPALVLFGALCIQLTVRIANIQEDYRLGALRQKITESNTLLRHYQLKYAVVTGPQNIAKFAHEKVGLQATRPQQIRRIVTSH